jgi:SNF2 family DNA or RNA helicase
MKIINNQDKLLIEVLNSNLSSDSEIFIAVSYISVLSLYELLEKFSQAKSIHVLIDNKNAEKDIRFTYDEAESKAYFDLKAKYKALETSDLLKSNCQIREGKVGGQKFILIKNNTNSICYSIVPNDLNLVTLGKITSTQTIYLNEFKDEENQYLNIFQSVWSKSNKDITQQIINLVDKAHIHNSPELIYKFTLNHIFQNKVINEISEQRIHKTGFKNTTVWGMLYNFQQDAVLGAIDKIETYGGCIIADSVGLGKTFEALAVMKYYQLRNDRILLLCPKKLRDNWLIYSQNDVRNILSKDRMNFDVLNHTDLNRERGFSGDINLETVNWGNYDLIVIDESHNFRNNDPRKETITRYQRLMNDIIQSGVKTKVLMLSATPVNTRMNDIKNQIAFITEQNDRALKKFGISSIEQTLRKAQQKFNHWLHTNNNDNTSRDNLVNSLSGDYFKLLDLLTIARSRKHIEKYYDVSDIGKFPQRLKPISMHSDFDTAGAFPAMDKVNNELNALNLKFYSPLSYVRDDKKASYEEKYDTLTSKGIFKQANREESLIHLMRVNLLKRLESSIHSFRLTLEALLLQIDDLLVKVENAQNTEFFNSELDITSVDFDDDNLEDLLVGGKVKVLLQDIDLIKCKEDLLDDKKRLENIHSQTLVVDSSRDAKLKDLKAIILNKIQNPLNPNNKKVVVFSAFADTVKYLYQELSPWLYELNLYSAQVTGGDTNRTNMPNCKAGLSSILINFSPLSKKRDAVYPDEKNQIDILFCTDCISEGQNLQDCDYLINYDIHWNPVRIIQRFGRIDRIGSINDKIQLVNFFPNLDLDNYIDLIGRVKGRMQILDVSATGDDNIIDETASQNQDLDYRKKQLKQLQNQILDLEDIEGGISITDLTFNDFKIDADRLTIEEKYVFDLTPNAIHSVTENNIEDGQKGVIFCVKELNVAEEDIYASNAIYPFSLCYVNEAGEIFIPSNNPKRCLDYLKKLCLGKTETVSHILSEFTKQTKGGKNMDIYTKLLDSAMKNIKGADEELGLDSLASPGGTAITKKDINAPYEIISFLVIK